MLEKLARMDEEKKSHRARNRKIRMALELGPETTFTSVQDLLSKVVEAAGGRAGLMTTWDKNQNSQTSAYGLDEDAARTLTELVEQAGPDTVNADVAARLEENALAVSDQAGGPLHAVALPVRSHDRSIGLLCLLFPSDTPSLLKEAPGVYNLLIDQVEVVVENAKLLNRLLKERRWLEAVVHHHSDGVVIMDREGLVIGFNLSMEKMSGWSLADAVGRPGYEVFPLKMDEGSGRPVTMVRLSDAPRTEHPAAPVEALLVTRSGRTLEVEVTGTALQDEEGRPLGHVMMLRDIHQRKEMERLQRIFLSAMSHELQTPIAIIKGFSGLLSDAEVPLSAEKARETASVIHEESERLERMVKQMLDATRIQAGGIKLQIEPVRINDLIRRTVQKMEPLAAAARTQLSVELPKRLPIVQADADRIQQVVINFIENALKYSGGGQVRISAQADPSWLTVSVDDSGPGVAEIDRSRIFELFDRGSGAKTVRGAGLGLFICKAIVDAHGGRIGVDDADLRGARFFFTLPLPPPKKRKKP